MSRPALAVIDSGGANLGSVQVALERLDVAWTLTLDAAVIASAERVLLPGVGAAATVMGRLRQAGLVDTLRALTQPLLGICVGMQVLYDWSAEGDTACLGLLPGRLERIAAAPGITVPHMGWNPLVLDRPDHPLLHGLQDGDAAYFVHSFAIAPDPARSLARVCHGGWLTAISGDGPVMGCQFHPERSAATGHRLLANFVQEVRP